MPFTLKDVQEAPDTTAAQPFTLEHVTGKPAAFTLADLGATTQPTQAAPEQPGILNQIGSELGKFGEETALAVPRMFKGAFVGTKEYADLAKAHGFKRANDAVSANVRQSLGVPLSESQAADKTLQEDLKKYPHVATGLTPESTKAEAHGLVNIASFLPGVGVGARAGQLAERAIANPVLARLAAAEAHSIASMVSYEVANAAIDRESLKKAALRGTAVGAAFPIAGKIGGKVIGKTLQGAMLGGEAVAKGVGKLSSKAELRSELYARGMDFLRLAGQWSGDGLIHAGATTLKKLGLDETLGKFVEARSAIHTQASMWDTRAREAWSGLKTAQRNLLGRMLVGTPEEAVALAQTEAPKKAADLIERSQRIRGVLAEVRQKAEASGVPLTDAHSDELRAFVGREDFGMPRVYTNVKQLLKPGDLRDQAMAAFQKKGISEAEGDRILKEMADRAENIDPNDIGGMRFMGLKGRQYDLPGFNTDPRAVLPSYFYTMARNIENHMRFGPEGPPSITESVKAAFTRPATDIITKEQAAVMSADELTAAATTAMSGEVDDAVAVFGPERAKQYERAQRTINSPTGHLNEARYEAASKLVDEMEKGLTPAQEQRLFGIGEPGMNAEDLKSAARVARDYSPDNLTDKEMWSTADLMNVVGRELLTGHPYENLESAIRLQNSMQELASRGMGMEAIQEAVTKRAIREGVEPADARMLLENTLEKLKQNQTPKLAAPAAEAPTAQAAVTIPAGKTLQERFPRAFEQLDALPDSHRKNTARAILEGQLGAFDKGNIGARIFNKTAQIQVPTKLMHSAITQLTQVFGAHIQHGFHGTLDGMVKLAARDPQAMEAINMSGAYLESLIRESESSLGGVPQLGSKSLHAVGMTQADRGARIYGAMRGFMESQHAAQELRKLLDYQAMPGKFKPFMKQEMARLEKKFTLLGLDPVQIVQQGGVLTKADMAKASQTLSTDVNFWSDALSLPHFYKTPWGRVFLQFKSFSDQSARFMKRAVIDPIHDRGDVEPLARALLLTGTSGELVQDLKGLIKGKPRTDQGMNRLVKDLAAGSMFGIWADAAQSTNSLDWAYSFVAGPQISDLVKLGYGMGQLGHGNSRPLGKQLLGTAIPLLTSQIPVAGTLLPMATPAIVNKAYPPQ